MNPSHPLSVKSTWLGPVADRFARIQSILSNPNPDLDAVEKLINSIPALYGDMDHDALADAFEAALGAATLTGALNSRAADVLVGLSSDEYETTVGFGPFEAAAAALDRKSAIGSLLNSREWEDVPAALRNRAMFSSRVEAARFLTEARDRLAEELRVQRESLANGKSAFFDRDSFIVSMRKIAQQEGIDTNNGNFDGGLRDIRSSKRLGLIYDVQTEMAEEYGRYRMDFDPDVLDAWPAKRLIRVEDREHKRDWTERWNRAAVEVGFEGVARGGDKVALKSSPIWIHLGPFGNPYPPFDFGSGMGTEDVNREEAESLGLVKADAPVDPGTMESLNARMEGEPGRLPADTAEWLEAEFGDQIILHKNGRASWRDRPNPYQTWIDKNLTSAKDWKPLSSPGFEDVTKALDVLRRGLSIKSADKKNVSFSTSVLSHWENTDKKDISTRASHLRFAIKTVMQPAEIWKQDEQRVYVQSFMDGKPKGMLVSVDDVTGQVKTFYPAQTHKLNVARKGSEVEER